MVNLGGNINRSEAIQANRGFLLGIAKLILVANRGLDKFILSATHWSLSRHEIYPFAKANAVMPNPMSDLELLLQNAQLRDELEPYFDESVYLVDLDRMSVRRENEFLASLLAWEKAPILPIANWFEPPLQLQDHRELDDCELSVRLRSVIQQLFQMNILLFHTGHLSDRQLYCLISRDILPSEEKKMLLPGKFLRWQCLDVVEDEESWLRYYATDDERHAWALETGLALPPQEELPFQRSMPDLEA